MTLAETTANYETECMMNASSTDDEDAHHEVGVSATTTAAATTTEQEKDEDDTDLGSFFLVLAFGLVTGSNLDHYDWIPVVAVLCSVVLIALQPIVCLDTCDNIGVCSMTHNISVLSLGPLQT